MIATTEHLILHLEKSRQGEEPPVCAIDTEADSLHRYRESLCLVQFAVRGESILIDPLAIEDLAPLASYLSEATVWMHGADYDMTMFKREFGELPAVVYDTQIGARLLGVRRFGLGDLVNQYFGIELSKSSQKSGLGETPALAENDRVRPQRRRLPARNGRYDRHQTQGTRALRLV